MKISEIVDARQLGPHADRIGVIHWEEDEFVVTVDGAVCGQTLHRREAIDIARWLSCALGSIVSGSIAAERERCARIVDMYLIPRRKADAWVNDILAEIKRAILAHETTSPSISSTGGSEREG